MQRPNAVSGGKFTCYQSMKLYRKYKANKIFNGREFLPADTVLIINENGAVDNLVAAADAGDDIRLVEGTLCPGFVNAHCHIELSHLKGQIPEHTGLVNFVQHVMKSRGEGAANEMLMTAMEQAAAELHRSGTVAVGDICNTAHAVRLKQQSPIYWHNFIEVSGFVAGAAAKRLEAMQLLLDLFKTEHALQQSSLSPHAPYSVSAKLFQLLNDVTAGQIISIHNQEAAAENELYRDKSGAFLSLFENFGIPIDSFTATGTSSFQSWSPYFNQGQRIIAVHNTFISEEDLKEQLQPVVFCICINANLYIENKLPPLDMLMQQDCDIVLGTDSYASNRQLNMMEEINSILHHFPHIGLEEVLGWATLNGARALGIEEKFGSFDKGKAPGLVQLTSDGKSRLL